MTPPGATVQRADRATLESLKLVALASGLRADPDAVAALGGAGALTVHEYATTGGITLELPERVLVNAPFDEPFCDRSPLELRLEDGAPVLALGGNALPVLRVLPLPGYLEAEAPAGVGVAATAMSHADRIRLSPISGCAYDCRFCDVAALAYRQTPVEHILAALDIALADRALPARHLLISGGSPPVRNARAQEYFEDVCLRVLRHVRARRPDGFEVDVMMSARPDGPGFVDRLVDAGIHAFSFNVEVFGEEEARRALPLKHKWSREHLEPMIRRAVERLGRSDGRVRSLIIPGLEPAASTLAGVEWLAGLGCSPVLSPFRPARGTALANADPVRPELLREVLDGARAIVGAHGVLLGPPCVACQHNTLSFPWDVEAVT